MAPERQPASRRRRLWYASPASPYDPERVEIFEALRAELASRAPNIRPFEVTGPNAVSNLAFFEAYFSNFIEGTEFEVSEAYDIVFRQAIPANRPRDAHDVLGNYRVVSDTPAMSRRPTDLDSLLRLMHDRHWMIMQSRPDKRPGALKEANNRAGDHLFVRPDLVRGTLDRGLELYRSLDGAFARAIYMMFLISEVHPYEDGNGRVARVMMNAEFVAEGQTRVIVPTLYRTEYLDALRALSTNKIPGPLIDVLSFAQRFVAAIPWESYNVAYQTLMETRAFLKPREAEAERVRLRIPSAEQIRRVEESVAARAGA